ncbi:phosphate ABC transporter permease PstA [Paludifilum halophilum]|uniref:Phosphate transport system permease protein PstA n=1 Tax=Paludifilum halophilum TaxID=1642702 RepID=A0A235B7V4_9BACL|nr:phosphate ABC transporter permease PstA [Paludifilum halophilum]OYD08393.1 phosphate ABC transporter, permease protein PstA [Paludifilum halophilum]
MSAEETITGKSAGKLNHARKPTETKGGTFGGSAGRVSFRRWKNRLAHGLFLSATLIGVIVLIILLTDIVVQGWSHIDADFFNHFGSRLAENAGIKAAFWGTIWVIGVTAPMTFLLGVATAIYLEEYAPKNGFTRFIQLNISNLAGVPSIVFGILGLTLFVREFGLGRSVLAGALTLTLLILPIVIVASREAIASVPASLKQASFAMGATRWQTVQKVVLPYSLPGILTGTILALSRAIGETAPLIMIGAVTYLAFTPGYVLDPFTVLPIQIYSWISEARTEFHDLAAAGIIVLLVMLLSMNALAIYLRNKFQRKN